MNVTATVPLSSVWQRAIEKNTSIVIDAYSHRNIMHVEVISKGLDQLIMPGEHIQTLLFYQDKLIDEHLETGTKEGLSDHVFIYTKRGEYRIVIVNKTYEYPFVIRSLLINI